MGREVGWGCNVIFIHEGNPLLGESYFIPDFMVVSAVYFFILFLVFVSYLTPFLLPLLPPLFLIFLSPSLSLRVSLPLFFPSLYFLKTYLSYFTWHLFRRKKSQYVYLYCIRRRYLFPTDEKRQSFYVKFLRKFMTQKVLTKCIDSKISKKSYFLALNAYINF